MRPGNAHSADGWEGVLKPVVARYRGKVSRIYFRADAAFAMPGLHEYLEAEGAGTVHHITTGLMRRSNSRKLCAGRSTRVSITLRSVAKSIGLLRSASTPFSCALRLVSASP